MGYTTDLADFAARTKFKDLPDSVVKTAKIVFFDTLMCGIAAQDFERTRMMHSIINQLDGPAESTVFGMKKRVSAANATMANAEIMNLLDADETFFSSSHFAAFNVSPAMAFGEREHSSGRDVILSLVLGFDVNARLNLSFKFIDIIDGQFRWAPISGMGFAGIGAAVSTGILLHLKQEQMRNLFGVAGQFAIGPCSGRNPKQKVWWTMKYSPYPAIALSGALAAMYAQAGYRADQTALDGEDGFWKQQGNVSTDQGLLNEELGKKWWIEEDCIKFYPSCRYTAAPIDMITKLMAEHKFKMDEIEHIDLKLNPMALALPLFKEPATRIDGNDHCAPLNGEFNLPYIMALVVLGIPPGPRWHRKEMYENPKIIDFMKRVTTSPDPAAVEEAVRAIKEERIGRFRKSGGSITVKARGKEYVLQTEYSKGDPWTPETKVNWDMINEKFHNFCGDIMTPAQMKKFFKDARNLDELKDVSHLLDFVRASDTKKAKPRPAAKKISKRG
jgi:2-methylcitrate dehydratase PrpD